MVGIIMCVYGSLIIPIPLFIQHLNICIKVFKAKCGDKVYMWVLVFSGRCVYPTRTLLRMRAHIKWTFLKRDSPTIAQEDK